ncbi:MAG TPA: hypothetical protein VM935_06120 [Chitinophagaceae bacterium]|jgi:hypothetical protein|nr:hypothetical protein [Chitinophagaceae bacterium]
MRKLIFSAIMVLSVSTLFAQNLEDVQEKISKGKYGEAQEKIDKLLADAKGQKNANAWYTKGIVYYNLSLDSSRVDKDYRGEAYEAFKKYYEMDPKNLMGTLEQNARMFQLYDAYYNKGIRGFNDKDFENSFKAFRSALDVETYILSKGFTYTGVNLPALDTSLLLNVAAAASKANMQDSAVNYYKRLADAKLTGENYIEIYQILIEYYGKKNDMANRDKYLALAKQLYPTNDYWYESELTPLREDKPKLIAKYEELSTQNPSSYYLSYNYAVELFNYLFAADKKPAEFASLESKLKPAIDKAIKTNSTSSDANLLMVRYLSEKIYQMEDSSRTVTGKTPADVKKKQGIVARTNTMWDELAPYADATFAAYTAKSTADLKGYEKGNLKFVTNVLVDYYTNKKQVDKAKSYQDKAKAYGI